MKKLFIVLFLTSYSTFSQVKPASDITYEVVNKESQLIWQDVPFVGKPHEGTIQLTSGTLVTSATGKAKGGKFVINMKSINSVNPKTGESNKGVVEHLHSDDFFSTMRFPLSTFIITKIIPTTKPNEYTITGNLTLKGISNVITFPSIIITEGAQLKAQAAVTIDRTLWGITYKSYSFLSQMKDDLIPNNIKLTMNLVFNKSL
ncbi:YceI family protein [Emticicia sp. BO119]|uniref:YceI family protein n=1 Tax=Emticicia sp. BO119 TaxID=2757768 RepID=UPI0015F0B83D|nr:YceI family protein [Emticicia sp. BO119]MBA4850726.1 YceI family protein [Emticicia sp. BO119]